MGPPNRPTGGSGSPRPVMSSKWWSQKPTRPGYLHEDRLKRRAVVPDEGMPPRPFTDPPDQSDGTSLPSTIGDSDVVRTRDQATRDSHWQIIAQLPVVQILYRILRNIW
ncbi:hypothetical protein GSI_10169 [Ganoderma sinense ZZ0214-1]|uniref:Uncharacterized protein n=1 Tax=Ganoderma sinense ZZ0214-1 TaxID=1077348 RepID=A0A2G8RZT4_9APHY|nr:hypothetical protein GSI_10169 [Ganoderma sinense ZZ0214-1]